jgi:protein-L-isoaspartate(D-aspartate) O-methyltransferase
MISDFTEQRRRMVRLIEGRGVRDRAVLDAMLAVRRELFLPQQWREFAYDDAPLPIGKDQTISQPYVVALMIAALDLGPTDRVLEVGTGSGYAAAVLGRIAAEVYTVERHEELAEVARQRLDDAGFDNVRVLHGDGTRGWPECASFDAIVVAAAGPSVPQPLLDQLDVGGRLVIPVGRDRDVQTLLRVEKTADGQFRQEDLGEVRFVPLLGVAGWEPGELEC